MRWLGWLRHPQRLTDDRDVIISPSHLHSPGVWAGIVWDLYEDPRGETNYWICTRCGLRYGERSPLSPLFESRLLLSGAYHPDDRLPSSPDS